LYYLQLGIDYPTEVSRISGISLSGYYYKPVKRHIQRLDPSIKERIRYIASERPKYG
jgi:hypothetical protein